MSDFFVDYIKEDMCNVPSPISEVHSDQDSYLQSLEPFYPSSHNVDVDVLFLLTQDEIRTIERPIQPYLNQLHWGSDQWEVGDPPHKFEPRTGIEDILRPSTPSETSLSASSDTETDLWSSVGCSDDEPSVPVVSSLTIGSEELHSMSDSSLPAVVSSFSIFPLPGTGNVQSQDQVLTESVCAVKNEEFPLSSDKRLEIQRPDITPDFSCAGKPARKSHNRSSRKRKAEQSVDEQRTYSPSPRVEVELVASSSIHRSRKLKAPSLGVIQSTSYDSQAVILKGDPMSSPETPFHDIATTESSPPGPTETKAGYNLRKRSLPGIKQEERSSTPLLIDETPAMFIGTGQQRRSLRNGPSARRNSHSSYSDFGTRTRSSSTTSSPGKRSLDPSYEDLDSDTSDSRPSQKRQQSDRKPSKRSKTLDVVLAEAGFQRKDDGLLHCPCRKKFMRPWDANRHWNNAMKHKLERVRKGDYSGLLDNYCVKCNQFLARKDSLERHISKCGLRKKRKSRIRVDQAGNVRAIDD